MATKKPAPKRARKPVKKAAKQPIAKRSQPETLRLRGIAASITASDLQRSIAFYRDVLGFWVGEEWREGNVLRGVELRAGAVSFLIDQDDFAKGRDRQKGVGFRLLCRTAQDLDRLAAEIKARGGVLDHQPQETPWGRFFTIVDPDGIKLSVVQER